MDCLNHTRGKEFYKILKMNIKNWLYQSATPTHPQPLEKEEKRVRKIEEERENECWKEKGEEEEEKEETKQQLTEVEETRC